MMMEQMQRYKKATKKIISVIISVVLLFGIIISVPIYVEASGYEVSVSNNVGTSQTVTITVDQGYYTGYYWGTNSNYENNPYTALSSATKTITKTVSSQNKYYFSLLKNYYNNQGQISGYTTNSYKPLSFERINLDANGGTVTYSYLIGLNGNKITLPTPKREGYIFEGWSSSLNSTQLFTSKKFATTADGNPSTIYAIWSTRNLNENEETEVVFNAGDSLSYYSIKPSSNANYDIYTTGSNDTMGYLYDKDMNLLTSSDIGGENTNFLINYDLQSGKNYYVAVKNKSNYSTGIKLFAKKTDATAPSVDYKLSKINLEKEERTIRFYIKDESLYDFEFIRLVSPNGSTYSIPDELDPLRYNTETDCYEVEYMIEENGTYRYQAMDDSNNVKSNDIEFVSADFDLNGGNNEAGSYFSLIVEKGEKIKIPTPKRHDYIFKGWSTNKKSSSGATTVSPQNYSEYYAIWKAKSKQIITAKSHTKTYGAKAFSLNAKASGKGKLTYKTSDKKVVTVSSKGKIAIKGCGKATITIKAAATSNYKAANKKISILIKPPKVSGVKIKKNSRKIIECTWKSNNKVTGYEIQACKTKTFKTGVVKTFKTSYKNTKYTLAMKTTNKCYLRIRTYKNYKGKKYNSSWVVYYLVLK